MAPCWRLLSHTCQLDPFNGMEWIMSLLLTRLPMGCAQVAVLDNIHDNHLWLKNKMIHADETQCCSSLAREWNVWKVWAWRKSSQHPSRKRRTSRVGGLTKMPYKECWRQQTQRRCFSITKSFYPNHGNIFIYILKIVMKHWNTDIEMVLADNLLIYNHIHEKTFYQRQSQTTTDVNNEEKCTRLRKIHLKSQPHHLTIESWEDSGVTTTFD